MWTEKGVQKVIYAHNPRSVLHVRVVGMICLSHSQLQNDVYKKFCHVEGCDSVMRVMICDGMRIIIRVMMQGHLKDLSC